MPATEAVKCPDCRKTYKNKRSLREHRRHHCKRSKTASPRKYVPSKCKHCGKVFHSANSLRVHVSTQHPQQYMVSPKTVKAHRAPLRTVSPKTEPRSVKGTERRFEHRAPAHSGDRRLAKTQPKTDQLLQQLASTSGDERTRRIWEEVLRQQHLQYRSARGQEPS